MQIECNSKNYKKNLLPKSEKVIILIIELGEPEGRGSRGRELRKVRAPKGRSLGNAQGE